MGFYSPLPVPSHPWDSIYMDFVGAFPVSKRGQDYLYVVVDRFNKMCVLIPCKKKINVEKTANFFFQRVWVYFGLPTSIISNRDSQFLGDFWNSLWRMMDTNMKRSTAFHWQADGQTEVVKKSWFIFFKVTATSILSCGMIIFCTFNMPTTEPCILPLRVLHLKHALGICIKFHWTWYMGNMLIQVFHEMKTRSASSFR